MASVRLYRTLHRAHAALHPPTPPRRRRDFFSDLDRHAFAIAWGCFVVLFLMALWTLPA